MFGRFFLFFILSGLILAQPDVSGKDTVVTASGLKYIVIEKGSGPKVEVGKEVAFDWTGYFENGKSFGSSIGQEPFYYISGLGQVIKGAEEGLLKMRVGDRNILIIPSNLAYGAKGSGETIPPNATLIFDYKVLSVTDPKLPLDETLMKVYNKYGTEKLISKYYEIKGNEYDRYSFREGQLNNIGYWLVQGQRYDDAVQIFELNAKEYPTSANVWDSLAEGYFLIKNYEKSLEYYQKSLLMNPDNTNAIEMIKKIESAGEQK